MMEHAEHSPAAIREKAAGAVNCQSVTLPSGLTVLCRTMPGYSSVHAMYATNFGSVVREFTLNGKRIQLPAGTAHFLEHKMFESEQGDAFDLYAKTGAAANAFTSYDRTCYIFTATGMTMKTWIFCSTWSVIPGLPRRPSPRSRASSGRKSKCMTTARIGGC